jgi:hypothetical protein
VQCGGFPFGLFVDANRVYWTAGGRQAVESASVLGGPGCTDGYIEVAESQGGLLFQAIRAEGSNLFWVDGTTLKTADISGCEANGSCVGQNRAVSDTPNFDLITAFTTAGDSVYFIDEKGNVFKSPKAPVEIDGGAEKANIAMAVGRDQAQFPIDPTDFSKIGSMVASDSYVYWTTSDCKIMSLPF